MSQDPQIILGGDPGAHNADLDAANARLKRGKQYRDLSTVCVVPTRGMIPARVVENWMGLMTPMNNAFFRIFVSGYEVGEAYNAAVEVILGNEQLAKFKYLLTLEEDNMPPPDGLLKLYESIDEFAAVGGLYWTKGEGGQPMQYGDPKAVLSFQPQLPIPGQINECNGLGMGFTLFRIEDFLPEEKPWFKTVQTYDPATGAAQGTQDLYRFAVMRKRGLRVACDARVLVGHLDVSTGLVW